ncbi:MAG: hypothetical protein IT239_00555 [Bacteroidia bacterium]|nr:hypothetical protein [Bacteroidia bacterium]
MRNKKLIRILIFVIAFGINWILNEYNILKIKTYNPNNLVSNVASLTGTGETIYSIDNEWYLPQVKYFMQGHGYTLNPLDSKMKVRRTPGYPFLYGLHYI